MSRNSPHLCLTVLRRAGAPVGKDLRGKALASYILAQAQDDYQVVFTLAEVAQDFAHESILLVDQRDGKPLPEKQGPFRPFRATDKAGARSVQMLRELKVVRLAKIRRPYLKAGRDKNRTTGRRLPSSKLVLVAV